MAIREAINNIGSQQGFNQPHHANEYADLDNPQRAQEIIAEARRRVAAGGGNPQHLQAMIGRVTNEFAQRDRSMQNDNVNDAYQQPNNMEAYIDRVLQMSGMTNAPQAAQSNTLPSEGPVPPERYAGNEADAGDESITPEDEAQIEQAANSGMPLGQFAALLAGTGGLLAAGRYLYNRYGRGSGNDPVSDARKVMADGPRSNVDDTIDAVDGNASRDVVPAQSRDVTEQKANSNKEPHLGIADQRGEAPGTHGGNAGSGRAITQGSSTDTMIEATMGDTPHVDNVDPARFNNEPNMPGTDRAAQDSVERSGERPSSQNRFNNEDSAAQRSVENDQTRPSSQSRYGNRSTARTNAAISRAANMPLREAVAYLRQQGIEPDEQVMRMLADKANSSRNLSGRQVRSAVRNAM